MRYLPINREFKSTSHEFIREALLSTPDWDRLQTLGIHIKDWGYVWRQPQVTGVLCDRILDSRLNYLVPDQELQACYTHLAHLKALNENQWHQVCAFGRELDARDIHYAMVGGPGQYYPLEVVEWPRDWARFDFDVHVGTPEELYSLATDIGAILTRRNDTTWDMALSTGVVIPLAVQLANEQTPKEAVWPPKEFPTQLQTMFNDTFRMLHPVPFVIRMATNTAGAVIGDATRMPLWALARLKAWTSHPLWYWEGFISLLRGILAETLATAPSDPAARELYIRNSTVSRTLWTLRMADRVYGIMGNRQAEDFIAPEPLLDPCPVIDDYPSVIDPTIPDRYAVLEWDQVPNDEEFIFGEAFDHGYAERIRSRMWKVRTDHPVRNFASGAAAAIAPLPGLDRGAPDQIPDPASSQPPSGE